MIRVCTWSSVSISVRVGILLQVVAAHLCYLVAGAPLQAWDPAARMCLPGADHRTNPRTFGVVPAIHRALVLEWARSQGKPPFLRLSSDKGVLVRCWLSV